jgi:hypothetical protein
MACFIRQLSRRGPTSHSLRFVTGIPAEKKSRPFFSLVCPAEHYFVHSIGSSAQPCGSPMCTPQRQASSNQHIASHSIGKRNRMVGVVLVDLFYLDIPEALYIVAPVRRRVVCYFIRNTGWYGAHGCAPTKLFWEIIIHAAPKRLSCHAL